MRFRLFTLSMMIFAGIGGVLYGYDIGIITGAMLFIRQHIPMTDQQMSLLAGAVLGGGALATLITGPLSDFFGRRKMILLASVLFLIGVFLVVAAHQYWTLMLGRIVQGIGVGIVTIAVPLYIAESVPSEVRGRGVSVFQLLLTAGILLASLVGLYFTPTGNWRGMFISAAVPGAILLIGCSFLGDSPRWLAMHNQWDKALKVLRRTRTQADAEKEIDLIRESLSHRMDKKRPHHYLWQRRFMVPLGIVLAVAVLNQLTGINSILQFSALILKQSGLKSNLADMLGSTLVTAVNFLVTLVVLSLVDKIGRRKLLTWGTAGIVISMIYTGFVYYLLPVSSLRGELLLIGIIAYILTYAMGPGVLVWLVLSELLPSRIRSTGMAIGLFLNSLTSTVLASVFLDIAHAFTFASVFWLCGGFTVIYFLIALRLIPETKGKTLEEIERIFET